VSLDQTTPGSSRRRLLVHLTTTDISLALLLGPQLKAYAAAGYEVLGVSATGPFVAELTAAGIRHVALPHATRRLSPANDARAAGELYRMLCRLKPDIVHTHNPKPGIYGRLAARAAGVPIVVNTVHGLYARRDDSLARRSAVYALERLATTCSDAELLQNPEDLETLAALRVPRSRLHLLGNGIDVGRFRLDGAAAESRQRLRAEWNIASDEIVVGVVGRLVWEKGYAEIFEATRLLRTRVPKARFVIAGPAEPGKADAVPSTAVAQAERDGVVFLGYRADVDDLYAALDVYVLASYREGFPRSAMEAAAMGVPIVATNIRGCRQVVDHGLTGLLVPPKDAGALAGAIERLARQSELRASMSRAAIVKAQEEFDERRVIDFTLALYARLLKERCGCP
jgi:glycosyltransferase involved in cell wall biosynthesis